VTNNELEFQKLIFEMVQHLTTLNTGVAVIVPVVAELVNLNFMTSVRALAFFFLSVFCSGLGMFLTAWRVNVGDNGAPIWLLLLLGVAWFFIVAGVVYFSAATIRVQRRRGQHREVPQEQ
jgi:hypothetical protein